MMRMTLTPPNRSALWSGLALTKAQLASLCGVTSRQISHWSLRGYIAASGQHPDRYSGEAIDICLLIKQGLDQGLPLRRAVGQARAFLAADNEQHPAVSAIEPMALTAIHARLQSAQATIAAILQVIEPLIPYQLAESTAPDTES